MTVPLPFPGRLTVNENAVGILKVAVTCWLALSVNVQEGFVPLLLQAPSHPAKAELAPEVSVRIT